MAIGLQGKNGNFDGKCYFGIILGITVNKEEYCSLSSISLFSLTQYVYMQFMFLASITQFSGAKRQTNYGTVHRRKFTLVRLVLLSTLKRTCTRNASQVTLAHLCFTHQGSYSSSIAHENVFKFYSLPKNISSSLTCAHTHFNTINYVYDIKTKPYYHLPQDQSTLIDSIRNTKFVIHETNTSKCAC